MEDLHLPEKRMIMKLHNHQKPSLRHNWQVTVKKTAKNRRFAKYGRKATNEAIRLGLVDASPSSDGQVGYIKYISVDVLYALYRVIPTLIRIQ
ncbi:10307_t:CDS:2 [Funneliformis caledonium]|uniref:10307_t:CDS:1 n=1 Tax=Funneliformis caledonium TaxID=1117310 RepID=A0A9N8YNC6_9GLOM|nr:10307_t:CDS:2 [Funneliformis caledonium]